MKINLQNAGKRFNREWVFRHFNYEFSTGGAYAITGPNGSGKSTLLQILCGASDLSEGVISHNLPERISKDEVYKKTAIAAPYLELIEEMTLAEFLSFHFSLKPVLKSMNTNDVAEAIGLRDPAHKQIRYYSSGMKQRVKLGQAIFSNVPVILLDEPCTNLDEEGIMLYKSLVTNYCSDRLVIVSSNDKNEYDFCRAVVDMKEIKNQDQVPSLS